MFPLDYDVPFVPVTRDTDAVAEAPAGPGTLLPGGQ